MTYTYAELKTMYPIGFDIAGMELGVTDFIRLHTDFNEMVYFVRDYIASPFGTIKVNEDKETITFNIYE